MLQNTSTIYENRLYFRLQSLLLSQVIEVSKQILTPHKILWHWRGYHIVSLITGRILYRAYAWYD